MSRSAPTVGRALGSAFSPGTSTCPMSLLFHGAPVLIERAKATACSPCPTTSTRWPSTDWLRNSEKTSTRNTRPIISDSRCTTPKSTTKVRAMKPILNTKLAVMSRMIENPTTRA